MKDIAIYGAGGLGREIASLITKINSVKKTWKLIGFFDDGKKINHPITSKLHNLGGIDILNQWNTPLCVILAFGNPGTIHYIHSKINNGNINFPNIISPDIFIADNDSFSIGIGNIICRGCSFSIENKIGSFNLFNGSTATGHDVTIGDFNVIMPGARISGEVKMGSLNLIGADSFIVQGLNIGDRVTVSPLSALLTKPKNDSIYIGNPAKIFKFL